MQTRDIEARRARVLDIIVRSYVDSAEPVGSKAVADEMKLSSATVRNIMSDLEKLGLVCQPYTSAGRVPTEKGYRFFVNFLMQPEDISSKDKAHVELIYELKTRSLEDIIEESSHILSYISSLATIAMFPRTDKNKLYLDGTYHILEQPEFRDSDKMRALFRVLEERKALLDIFSEDLAMQGAKVRIGSENRSSALRDCSTITASYRMSGNTAGTITVLGPTRMDYGRLVSAVNYLAWTMSDFLDEVI